MVEYGAAGQRASRSVRTGIKGAVVGPVLFSCRLRLIVVLVRICFDASEGLSILILAAQSLNHFIAGGIHVRNQVLDPRIRLKSMMLQSVGLAHVVA